MGQVRTWVGLDPSLTGFGYAVLSKDGPMKPLLRDVGTWAPKIDKNERLVTHDRARRVAEIGGQLIALLQEHEPLECVYIEGLALGMKTSHLAVQSVGRMRGLVEGICLARGLELVEIAPAMLKHIVTGRKNGTKEDVARVVVECYRAGLAFPSGALDDNATDALAVAHVGAYRHGSGVTVKSGTIDYRAAAEDDGGMLDI